MDAAGRPGLGRWCWLRQGPGWQRAGAQEQQQAAFEGAESRVRTGGIPETRPRSPMKDKPAARRPPAGLGIDDPAPLGCRGALARVQARAGPPHEQTPGDSQAAAQVRNVNRAHARPCFPRAPPRDFRAARSESRWRPRVHLRFHPARVETCMRSLRAAFRPECPPWRARRMMPDDTWACALGARRPPRVWPASCPITKPCPEQEARPLEVRSRAPGGRGRQASAVFLGQKRELVWGALSRAGSG